MQSATSLKRIVEQKVDEGQKQLEPQPIPSQSIQKKAESSTGIKPYYDTESFTIAQRMATSIASSDFIPEVFRNKLPNCMLALEVSSTTGASVMAVMQNMFPVKGKPAYSGKFIIGLINSSGKFKTPLLYDMEYDQKTGEPIACSAYAFDRYDNKLVGPKVTMKMVISEGWIKNEKWKNMPDVMFRYRAASFFGNVYTPEITMGMQTVEEVEDTYITPSSQQQQSPQPQAVNEPMPIEIMDAIVEEDEQIVEPVAETPNQSVQAVDEALPTIDVPQLEDEPIEFDMPTSLDDLEMLMIDLMLGMEIKNNGKGSSYAGVKGVTDPRKAEVLVKIGFKTKGDTFVLDVTEFVIKQEAEDAF